MSEDVPLVRWCFTDKRVLSSRTGKLVQLKCPLHGNWLRGGGHETTVVGAAFIGRVGEEGCLCFG